MSELIIIVSAALKSPGDVEFEFTPSPLNRNPFVKTSAISARLGGAVD